MTARLAALLLSLAFMPWAAPARADGTAGAFDYYILSLSWSPSWCAAEGQGRAEPQCDPRRRTGFVVHGLWPQYERGWPADCATGARDPTRRETQAMADVMGSGGLAWHQWRKHGRCSGLTAADYYRAIRQTRERVAIPPVFRMLPRDVRLPANVVEDAFIQANPELTRDAITVTCTGERLDEVRICLTRDLTPRPCAPDSRRDCRAPMLVAVPG